VTSCSLVEFFRSFKGTYSLHFKDLRVLGLLFEHKDRGSRFLRNVGGLHGVASQNITFFLSIITSLTIATDSYHSCSAFQQFLQPNTGTNTYYPEIYLMFFFQFLHTIAETEHQIKQQSLPPTFIIHKASCDSTIKNLGN
jgi:hypothetical protein